MTSYATVEKLYKSGRELFTTLDLRLIFGINSERTFEDTVQRAIDNRILIQIEKGKYKLSGSSVNDFEVAQFLYSPSYISFETALNFHGILEQFPFSITSGTTKKSCQKEISGKIFTYSKLNKSIYVGYYKEQNFLMAYPEKALFDQVYMSYKGLRSIKILEDLDYKRIDMDKFNQYVSLLPTNIEKNIKSLINKYL